MARGRARGQTRGRGRGRARGRGRGGRGPPAEQSPGSSPDRDREATPALAADSSGGDESGDDLREALEQSLVMLGVNRKREEELRRKEEEDFNRAIQESLMTSARAAVEAGTQLAQAARGIMTAGPSGVMAAAAATVSNVAASASSAAARLSEEAARLINSSGRISPGVAGPSRRGRSAARGARRGGRRGGRRTRQRPSEEEVRAVVDLCDSSVNQSDNSVLLVEDDRAAGESSEDFELSAEESDGEDDEYRPPDSTSDSRPGVSRAANGQGTQAANGMTDDQVAQKMRAMYENSLKLHASGEYMQACKAIKTRLYPHQMYALAWMAKRENSKNVGVPGGILADDMGLGKSLTVLALIMTNFHDERPLSRPIINFKRVLPKGVVRYLPRQRFDFKAAVASTESEPVPDVSRTQGKMSLAMLMGGAGSQFKKTNQRHKIKSSKPKMSAIALLSGDATGGCINSGTSKEAIARDVAQIDESLLSDNDSADEFDSMLAGDKGSSLAERLGVDKNSDLFSSSQDEGEHHNDGLSDDEEYMKMSAKEKEIKFKPKLNVDGATATDSEDEDFVPAKRKRSGRAIEEEEDEEEALSERKLRRVTYSGSSDEDLENGATGEDEEDELPDLDQSVSSVKDKVTPTKSSPELTADLVGAPLLSPEQTKNLLVPPGKPALKGSRPGATLIVTPASLLAHWVEQIEAHVDRRVDLRVFVHYGQSKASFSTELSEQHVVLTTYGTLSAEFGQRSHSPLLATRWLRVCLDEGHSIKNHRTKVAKAAANLMTARKWIVSGTPIQNNLSELWSLLLWLKFEPYASHRVQFKNEIESKVKHGDPRGFQRLQTVIEAICLRRTKADQVDGQPLVKLPKKNVVIKALEFTEEERVIYKAFLTDGRNVILNFLRKGALLKNWAHVFAIMMRLRQLCCHEELLPIKWKNLKEGSAFDDIMKTVRMEEAAGASMESAEVSEVRRKVQEQLRDMIRSGMTDDCSICLSDLNMPCITLCGHAYCRPCITEVIDTARPPPARCPLCRADIKKDELEEAARDDEADDENGAKSDPFEDIVVDVSSTKVNAALKEMEGIRRDQPEAKIIVVSQFTSFLSILQPLLDDAKFCYTRLDGTMTTRERSEVVANFQDPLPESPKVLLLSLKAGGVGLNLTAASHMILLDPAWNPATEEQCFDRIHRLGQARDVTITKFVMKDSIEEKMLELQDKKRRLISGAFTQSDNQRREQRIQDIRSIFSI